MKIKVIASIALLLFGCSELHQYQKAPECKELIESIQAHWQYDESSDLYKIAYSDLELLLVKHESCLKGMKEKTIVNLFGPPHQKLKTKLIYELTPGCKGRNGLSSNGCYFYEIVLSEENSRVIDLGMISVSTSH